MSGMTTEKIAVSIPAAVLARARKAARREHAPSLSAYVSAALEEKSTLDDLSHLLEAMLAESGGALTQAERRRADQVLLGPVKRRRRT